jgi:hypothetical protein
VRCAIVLIRQPTRNIRREKFPMSFARNGGDGKKSEILRHLCVTPSQRLCHTPCAGPSVPLDQASIRGDGVPHAAAIGSGIDPEDILLREHTRWYPSSHGCLQHWTGARGGFVRSSCPLKGQHPTSAHEHELSLEFFDRERWVILHRQRTSSYLALRSLNWPC